MYPEFIAIYVGLAILLVLNIVTLVFVIGIKRNGGSTTRISGGYNRPVNNFNAPNSSASTAFCKKCANQIDASERVCPHCGTPR